MADSLEKTWSDGSYAPQIPHSLYFEEKAYFAGVLVGAIFYGIIVTLFFRCMHALLNPVNPAKKGIKWPLVIHTTAMFLFITIYTGTTLYIHSNSYIDDREFPSTFLLPRGPIGCQFLIYSDAVSIVPFIMFILNNWLADGLFIYRCYVIYTMNYWAISFPFLMYLASLAMGIAFICKNVRSVRVFQLYLGVTDFGLPYYSISLLLNIVLTLMIVTRLALHSRDIRNALGPLAKTSGLYKTVITMLVESFSLYAATFPLFIGPWAAGCSAAVIFLPVIAETQVIAPFLITLRVANRNALTRKTVSSGDIGSIRISPGRSTGSDETLAEGDSAMHESTLEELRIRVRTASRMPVVTPTPF